MDNSEMIMKILVPVMGIIALLVFIAIIVGAIFLIKHLIKFTTRTIYEEKARAEERHRKSYDPEGDR
nr:hypothetical protein [uncultured Oscillibacter sp.]